MRARLLEALAVLAAYTGVAVLATWPLARHPLGGFYGFGNDNWGGIPYLGWLHDAYLGPASASFLPELQAPYGLEIPQYAIQPVDRLLALVLGGFDQGLGAYNVQIFASFVLSGCTMYLLARWVTGSVPAALLAGFVYTFSPFHLALAMQYNALASIQWIPLYLLALLALLRHGTVRAAILTGAAFALVAAGSYYYAWFVGWFTVLVLVAWALVETRGGREGLKRGARMAVSRSAVAGGAALVLLLPLLFTSARAAQEEGVATLEHPLTEAVRYSARPWMLFVPPLDNPLAGDRVRPWVENHLYESPVYEQSIYIGYAVLGLAALALLRRRSRPARERTALLVFGSGALAAGLIMMGPYLPLDTSYWRLWAQPDETRHMPSLGLLMFDLAPVFRFFTRAFVLLSACLAVLAAIGFARLERRAGNALVGRVALLAAAVGAVGLEFANAPPRHWYGDSSPPWVGAVQTLPSDATVVDYPLSPAFSPRSLYYMFWQTKHRRRTVNPSVSPEAVALSSAVTSADAESAGRALHEAGVDYAVIHTQLPPATTPPYQPALPSDAAPPGTGTLNPWLEPVRTTPDAVIYRVRSSPLARDGALARPGRGFGALEPDGARWLESPAGELDVIVAGKPRSLVLRLQAASFAIPRKLAVRFRGRTLARADIPADRFASVAVRLGPLAAGSYTVTLVPRPGPQSIAEATGQPDPRSVSIRLREDLRVVAAGSQR